MVTEMHRAAQGVHGVGSAEYSQEQYVRVVAAFLGRSGPVTALELHRMTGVPGLTVRQNKSGKSRVGPLVAEITERGAARPAAQEGRDGRE